MKVKYINHSGSDLTVVNSARVSFDKESEWEVSEKGDFQLLDKDKKLLKYLADHKHLSPFNHTFVTLYVKAPIFLARQLQKHEYMPWNEVSRRYVDDDPEFYTPREWRLRPKDGIKQGSGSIANETIDDFCRASEEVNSSRCLDIYRGLLGNGVAPEMARMVLPQNTYTEWYWSGTLGAWNKMYKLRIDSHAQYEAQVIAKQCGDIIGDLFPSSWEALNG